jgi:hypothetical protein
MHRSQNTFSSEGQQINRKPPLLLKASVKLTRNGTWWLIDTGTIVTDTDKTNENSEERTTLNPWCCDHVNMPLNTDTLLHEIRAGAVWIISDGSYDLT